VRPHQPGDLAGFGIGRWIGQWEVERLSTNVTQVDASKIGRLLHDPVNSTQRRWIRSNFPNLPRCAPPTRANHVHLSRSSQNVKGAEAALTATAIPSFDARRLHRPRRVGSIASPQSSQTLGRDSGKLAAKRRIRSGVPNDAPAYIGFVISDCPAPCSLDRAEGNRFTQAESSAERFGGSPWSEPP
jgi:hypothetical protein